MEKIEIRVELQQGHPVNRHWHALFGVAGGTIGRGGQNKLVLPDEDAGVARVHAMVRLESEGAFIANLCERRSLRLNGTELRSGQELRLPLGAAIVIGPYTLRAVAPGTPLPERPASERAPDTLAEHHPMSRQAPEASPLLQPVTARPLLIPADFDTFAPQAATAVSAGSTPWGDSAGAGLAGGLLDVAGAREDSLLQALPPLAEVAQRLDNPARSGLPEALEHGPELDPLRLFSPPAESQVLAQTGTQGARGDSLSQVFSLPRRADEVLLQKASDPLKPMVVSSAEALRPAQGVPSVLLADTPPPAEPSVYKLSGTVELVPQTSFDLRAPTQHAPSLRNPASPVMPDLEPPLTAAQGIAPGVAVQAQATVASWDEQPLIAAFLEGVGLDPGRVQMRLTPEFMRDFGAVLRIAVQGTIDLMAARSEIKREFRADVTVIASGANNPLKFLPTAEGVVLQLLGHSFPGFMAPLPAMKEAYQDLQGHQLALMAGIRAACVEALTRFDPVALEKQLPPLSGGVIGRWSATRRKAALWDGYRQSYLDIRRHAEDDLAAFSGRTFVQAYEAAADTAGRAT